MDYLRQYIMASTLQCYRTNVYLNGLEHGSSTLYIAYKLIEYEPSKIYMSLLKTVQKTAISQSISNLIKRFFQMSSSGFNSVCWGDSAFKKYMSMQSSAYKLQLNVYIMLSLQFTTRIFILYATNFV